MKRLVLCFLLALMPISVIFAQQKSVEPDYVDLGLPSGTLWKDKNEKGFYQYDKAIKKFSNLLPTKTQWEELKDKCKWDWTGKGVIVTGPNGNSIFLPAKGGRYRTTVRHLGKYGLYWSSTNYNEDFVWGMYFCKNALSLSNYVRNYGLSVRLVKDKTN